MAVGGVRMLWHGNKVLDEFVKKAERLLQIIAIKVTNKAKQLMKDTKGVRKPGAKHPVSLPWNAPAVQEGGLVSSVNNAKVGRLKYRVGSGEKKGLYLEVGAPSINLFPRPWLRPALFSIKEV